MNSDAENAVDKGQLLNEKISKANSLILEALDKQQIAAAVSAIKILRKIDFGQLTTLSEARTKAVEAAVKAIGGQKGLLDKIKGFFKSGGDNPIVDSLAFVSSATAFFGSLSDLIGALGDDEVTVLQAIAPRGEAEALPETPTDAVGYVKAFIESQKKSKPAKDLYRIVAKGFEPEGELQTAGKGWVNRYLGGKSGMQQLTAEILKMKVGDLKKLSTSIENALRPIAEKVNQIKITASSESPESEEKESSTASSETPSDFGERLESAIKKAEPRITDKNSKAVAGIINKLVSAGTLKVNS